MAILSLFNGGSTDVTMESVSIELSEYGGVQPTTESLHEIYMESSIDFASMAAATCVMDIVVTEASIFDPDKATVMMENAVMDMLRKLKENIIKLWKKVKAWFLKMIENIKIFFSTGDKFIKEYESALKSKNLKDFEIETYPFEKGDSKVDNMIKACVAEREKAASAMDSASGTDAAVEESEFDQKKEDLLKKLNAGSESDFNDVVQEHYGMKTGKTEIKDFSKGLSKEEMIKVAKSGKEPVSKLTQASKDADNAFKTLISKIDKYAGKDGMPPVVAGNLKKWSAYATTIQGWVNKLYSEQMNCEKAMYNESIRVLKSYMYYRGSKEDKLKAAGIHGESTTVFESFSL